jgi:glutamate synthase (NADPH/NADH) large chain
MVRDACRRSPPKPAASSSYAVKNIHRSIGARLSGEIARRTATWAWRTRRSNCKLTGSAGQSFGVWNAGGLHLYLEGDANDYVGKGMAGGKLVLYPPSTVVSPGQRRRSSAIPACMAPPAACCTRREPRASASRCAIPGRWPCGRGRRSRLRIHDRRRGGGAGRKPG